MKIGIIAGSIRQGRKADSVAQWVQQLAAKYTDAEFEILDLQDFNIPLLDAPVPPGWANRQYEDEGVRRWSAAVDSCDGFVFVTTEYNHGVPGAFKNAVDSLSPEWAKKTVAFVAYGASDGIRAVEQWRQILSTFSMIDIGPQVGLSIFTDFDEAGSFAPGERREGQLDGVLSQLLETTQFSMALRGAAS